MTVARQPSGDDRLILAGDFLDFPVALLFAYWVRPDLLTQWWPRAAQVQPYPGGTYRFSWPERGDTLTGRYTIFKPSEELAFTWHWEHEPASVPALLVTVTFAPLPTGDGSALTLTQGPYKNTPDDQERRASHLEGWTYFLNKLQSLAPATDWTRGLGNDEP